MAEFKREVAGLAENNKWHELRNRMLGLALEKNRRAGLTKLVLVAEVLDRHPKNRAHGKVPAELFNDGIIVLDVLGGAEEPRNHYKALKFFKAGLDRGHCVLMEFIPRYGRMLEAGASAGVSERIRKHLETIAAKQGKEYGGAPRLAESLLKKHFVSKAKAK